MLHIPFFGYVGQNMILGSTGDGGTGWYASSQLLRMNLIDLSQMYYITTHHATKYLFVDYNGVRGGIGSVPWSAEDLVRGCYGGGNPGWSHHERGQRTLKDVSGPGVSGP